MEIYSEDQGDKNTTNRLCHKKIAGISESIHVCQKIKEGISHHELIIHNSNSSCSMKQQ
jgi:hypothetical protein